MTSRGSTATADVMRCPDWCAGGHYCDAHLTNGTHASTPEVWATDVGRVIATRRGGHLELLIVVKLPRHEEKAVAFMRHVVAAAVYVISRAVTLTGRANRR